jgi:hypothetical protein
MYSEGISIESICLLRGTNHGSFGASSFFSAALFAKNQNGAKDAKSME